MSRRIRIDKSFERALRSLPPDRQKAVSNSLTQFMQDPLPNKLDFRSLKGAQGYFIINARKGDRIILCLLEDDLYAAVDVGPHDNIYGRWNRR